MVRFITGLEFALVLDHAQYLHTVAGAVLVLKQRTVGAVLRALKHGGKHRVPCAVSLVDARRHGLGVGDVTGDGVQARGLCTHAATGDIENTG